MEPFSIETAVGAPANCRRAGRRRAVLLALVLVAVAPSLGQSGCGDDRVAVPAQDATTPISGLEVWEGGQRLTAAPSDTHLTTGHRRWELIASASDHESGVRTLGLVARSETTTCDSSGCRRERITNPLQPTVVRPPAQIGTLVPASAFLDVPVDIGALLPATSPRDGTKVDEVIEIFAESENYLGGLAFSPIASARYSAGSLTPRPPESGSSSISVLRPPGSEGVFVGSLSGDVSSASRVESVTVQMQWIRPDTWERQSVLVSHAGAGPVAILNRGTDTTTFNGTSPAGEWKVEWGGNIVFRPDYVWVQVKWGRP